MTDNLDDFWDAFPALRKFLDEHGIKPECIPGNTVPSIGFSERDQKWYGWSHRAIYGFGIGGECNKGDCHYTASTPEEMIEDRGTFFGDISDESRQRAIDECAILPDRSGIIINHEPLMVPMVEIGDDIAAAIEDPSELPETDIFDGGYTIRKCGRGEWTAKTLNDAKQMAIDFAKGVA